eukprot:scaffold101249_cov17-Tisochrysis_lutea.AAC.1
MALSGYRTWVQEHCHHASKVTFSAFWHVHCRAGHEPPSKHGCFLKNIAHLPGALSLCIRGCALCILAYALSGSHSLPLPQGCCFKHIAHFPGALSQCVKNTPSEICILVSMHCSAAVKRPPPPSS